VWQLPYDHDGPCDNYHTITTVRVTTTIRPRRSLWQLPYDLDHDGPCDNYHTISTTTIPVTTTIRSRPRRSLWQLPYDLDHDGPCDNYHTITTTTIRVQFPFIKGYKSNFKYISLSYQRHVIKLFCLWPHVSRLRHFRVLYRSVNTCFYCLFQFLQVLLEIDFSLRYITMNMFYVWSKDSVKEILFYCYL
jgi:hypothetical protein